MYYCAVLRVVQIQMSITFIFIFIFNRFHKKKKMNINWLEEAKHIIGNHRPTTAAVRYRQHFGLPPEICAKVWQHIAAAVITQQMLRGIVPVHLLWALYFLRHYTSESVMCSNCRAPSLYAFRKYTELIIGQIASLKIIYVRCLFSTAFGSTAFGSTVFGSTAVD